MPGKLCILNNTQAIEFLKNCLVVFPIYNVLTFNYENTAFSILLTIKLNCINVQGKQYELINNSYVLKQV